jgi:hypothetical protein
MVSRKWLGQAVRPAGYVFALMIRPSAEDRVGPLIVT